MYMQAKAVLKERRSQKMNNQPINLNEDCSPLTVQELEDAELAIIRFTQFQSFERKLHTLGQAGNNKLKHEEQSRSKKNEIQVGKTSLIYHLERFMDKGLFYVGGRLNTAEIPQESKHPIILPRKSNVNHLSGTRTTWTCRAYKLCSVPTSPRASHAIATERHLRTKKWLIYHPTD